MKRVSVFYLTIIGTIFLYVLSSCSFYTMPYENAEKIAVEHVTGTGDIRYTINITDEPVDVFFSFTNVNETSGTIPPDVEERVITVNGISFPAPVPHQFEVPKENRDPLHSFIDTSSRELISTLEPDSSRVDTFPVSGIQSFDTVGDTASLGEADDESTIVSEPATCRAVVGPVSTNQGERTLNIWVADDCWHATGSGKSHYINQQMVTDLADRFLKAELDNDIYDWVTNIFGPEWGATDYSNLIPFDNEITILLSDVYDDNSDNGGVVGYFWPVHNYTDSPGGFTGSNERIMFVVDAVMYANPVDSDYAGDEDGWKTTDYWPRVVFSTLAHEFQHMIHFYQKTILRAGTSTETWINEMSSMLTEDFLADKIGVEGPRGVSPSDPTAGSAGNINGRIPIFNEYFFRSLLVDYPDPFILEDYSVVYAFGAYLARNYGGAEFLNRVVNSPYTDKQAIEEAVRANTGGAETFERLLQRWGAAVFLSDKTAAPPEYRYNAGGWFSSQIADNDYNLGSINLYNYSPVPQFATSAFELTSGLNDPGSNIYLLAEEGATGRLSWDITLPSDVRLTVIFKRQ